MNKYINKVIELFSKGKPSDSTIAEFHTWLVDGTHEDEKDEALLHLWNEPSSISREDSYKAYVSFLTNDINHKIKPKTKRFRLTRWSAAVAVAFVVLCSGLVYTLFNSQTIHDINFVEHYSPIGEVNSITLPDGSIVETNSTTVLVYPDDFGKNTRTLYLTGEANFKVIRNEKIPFIVKSKGFSTTALGTEFNIASYPNEDLYKATLISGSIKVNEDADTGFEQILDVSQQFVYNRDTNIKFVHDINLEDETAWQRGEMMFRGVTIREIIRVLERNYNVVFHYSSKKNIEDKYNFKFKKDTSLVQVLEVIKNVADNFNYKLTDDLCYIYVK